MLNYTFLANALIKSALIAAVSAVSSCGGGGGSSMNGSNSSTSQAAAGSQPERQHLSDAILGKTITKVGVVQYKEDIDEYDYSNPVHSTVEAKFFQYNNPITATTLSSIAEFYSTAATQDYCIVRIWESLQSDHLLTHPINLEDSQNILAGEVLPLLGSIGTIAELTHAFVTTEYYMNDNNNYGYLEEHLPNDAYLSIPGDDFPAFDRLDIPDIDIVENFNVSNTRPGDYKRNVFTAESAVTWDVSAETSGYVGIHVYSSELDENLPTEIYCYTKDDGEFTLPPQIQTIVTEHEFPDVELSIWRDRFAYNIKDDTLVVIHSTTRARTNFGFLFSSPKLFNW